MTTRKKRLVTPEDPWLIGYQFANSTGHTPYDYIVDEEVGRRRKGKAQDGEWLYEMNKPIGTVRIDLTKGVGSYVTLAPLATWDAGFWLSDDDADKDTRNEMLIEPGVPKTDRWNTWVVDGEGTPMNYEYRLYLLPQKHAQSTTPMHPSKWSAKEKETQWDKGYSYNGLGDSLTTKSQGLPIGLRIRCQSCGHWYSESELKDHITSACPGTQGGSTEWIIPCDCCLPTQMDLMAVCKKGFPRPVKDTPAPKAEEPQPTIEQVG
jgi:hypothetical protein